VAGLGFGMVAQIPTATQAFADTVVDGCTIVSNPTPTHFTDCQDADLSNASFAGWNLSYANLSLGTFTHCMPAVGCNGTDFTNANLTDANLSGSWFDDCIPNSQVLPGNASCALGKLSDANLAGANIANDRLDLSDLSNATLQNVTASGASLILSDLTDANLTGADLQNVTFDGCTFGVCGTSTLNGVTITGANFTGTQFVPANQTVPASGSQGAVVSWPTSAAVPGVTPGQCQPPTGSTFPYGTTTVTCSITDGYGNQASGTFQVTVPTGALRITTTSLPPATIGEAYSAQLNAFGGNPPYSWKIVHSMGALPKGLHLDRFTGVISGTPKNQATTSTFTVEVKDTRTSRKVREAIVQATLSITIT